MDGEIVYPGDLHGRVLPANEIELAWDGNAMSALIGDDLVVGVSGFGDSVDHALRDLADDLVEEAVWIEVADDRTIDPARVRASEDATIQTDVAQLYRVGEGRICAFAGLEDSLAGIFGVGESVHQAVSDLADKLVEHGVCIEVTARREWVIGEISEDGSFPLEEKSGSEKIDGEDDAD